MMLYMQSAQNGTRQSMYSMSAVPVSQLRGKSTLASSPTETCFPFPPLHCPPNTKAREYTSAHFLLEPPLRIRVLTTTLKLLPHLLTSPPLPPLAVSAPLPSHAGDPPGSVSRFSLPTSSVSRDTDSYSRVPSWHVLFSWQNANMQNGICLFPPD